MSPPAWWGDRIDTGGIDPMSKALRFENAVATQVSAVRPARAGGGEYASEEWSVSLSEADVNSWLSTRLSGWLASQGTAWPEGKLTPPFVQLRDGVVVVAVGVIDGESERVVSLECVPAIYKGGGLVLTPHRMYVGRLRVPFSQEWFARLAGGGDREAMEKFLGERPLADDAVIPVDEARRVRIVKITPRAGRLEVVARTEAK